MHGSPYELLASWLAGWVSGWAAALLDRQMDRKKDRQTTSVLHTDIYVIYISAMDICLKGLTYIHTYIHTYTYIHIRT